MTQAVLDTVDEERTFRVTLHDGSDCFAILVSVEGDVRIMHVYQNASCGRALRISMTAVDDT